MATIGKRGKYAEGKVRDYFKMRSEKEAGFWFYRYPDARAGSAQVVPADFEVVYKRQHYLVEVKEVVHDFRLPSKNFDAGKVARMVKAGLSGSEGVVIVYHSTTKLWRCVPITVFQERKPSWDLTHHPAYDDLGRLMTYCFGMIQCL